MAKEEAVSRLEDDLNHWRKHHKDVILIWHVFHRLIQCPVYNPTLPHENFHGLPQTLKHP